MKRAIPFLLALALLASCGSGRAADSGIRGRALAGPQCPVEVAGSPCPDLPYRGTVVAVDVETGDDVQVETDEEGRFEIALPPGTYEVTIVPGSGAMFAKPRTVTVSASSFTEITLAVDTGIR